MASETIKRVRLDEVCEMNMGQSPDSKSYNQEERGLPFYQGNADFGVLHPSPRYWCDSPTKVADKDDILISVRAPIGALNIADSKCCIGRGLAALRPKACCDLWYLYFFLKSRVGELNAKGTGSTFKAINKKNLAETSVSLPPLPVQRRIAAALDKISEMKRNAEARLQKLDLLVKARFNEMFERGVASMPPLRCDISSHELEDWASTTIEGACSLIADCPHTTAPDEGAGYPLVRTPNVGKGRLLYEKMHRVSEKVYNERNFRAVPSAGDLILAREAPAGNVAVVQKGERVCLGQRTVLLRPDFSRFDSTFMAYYILSSKVQRVILGRSSGSTVAHLNVKDIKKLSIPLPPLSHQRSFAAFVEKVEALKATAQASLARVDLLYRAKLQEYFG